MAVATAASCATASRGLVGRTLRSRRAWQSVLHNTPPHWGRSHWRHNPREAVALGSRVRFASADSGSRLLQRSTWTPKTIDAPIQSGSGAAAATETQSSTPATASDQAASSGSQDTASDQAASSGSQVKKDAEKTKDEDEKKSGWGTYFGYAVGWISGITFLWNFYKEGYSLHRTEIALVNAIRRLPLYSPPGPYQTEANSSYDGEGLSPELTSAFCEWFVSMDLQQAEGVVRDDVLELFQELGFPEDSLQIRRYVERGEGQLEERRRMSGTGLQESLSLLADLALRPSVPKLKEGEEPPPDPRTLVGASAVELLRKKVRGVASISANAQVLQQMMQPAPTAMPEMMQPAAAAQDNLATAAAQRSNLAPQNFQLAPLSDAEDDEEPDDAHQLQLEAARLQRLEETLMARLASSGSLSAAEEGRLRDIRSQRAALNSRA